MHKMKQTKLPDNFTDVCVCVCVRVLCVRARLRTCVRMCVRVQMVFFWCAYFLMSRNVLFIARAKSSSAGPLTNRALTKICKKKVKKITSWSDWTSLTRKHISWHWFHLMKAGEACRNLVEKQISGGVLSDCHFELLKFLKLTNNTAILLAATQWFGTWPFLVKDTGALYLCVWKYRSSEHFFQGEKGMPSGELCAPVHSAHWLIRSSCSRPTSPCRGEHWSGLRLRHILFIQDCRKSRGLLI